MYVRHVCCSPRDNNRFVRESVPRRPDRVMRNQRHLQSLAATSNSCEALPGHARTVARTATVRTNREPTGGWRSGRRRKGHCEVGTVRRTGSSEAESRCGAACRRPIRLFARREAWFAAAPARFLVTYLLHTSLPNQSAEDCCPHRPVRIAARGQRNATANRSLSAAIGCACACARYLGIVCAERVVRVAEPNAILRREPEPLCRVT
jgi:hypothetical protein